MKSIGMQILDEVKRELSLAIVVPNSYLPEQFHDKVRGGRTLARLEQMCDVIDGVHTAHQKAKAAKARNIQKLAKQVEKLSRYNNHGDFVDIECGLDYTVCEVDEIQLYKNEVALVSGMVNSGMIDEDDLSDE